MARSDGKFKWVVLFVLVFSAALLNFSNMVFASRPVDVMAQFHMDQAQLTAISSVGVLPGALFSILMGNYFDRHSAKSIRHVGFALLVLAAACQVARVFAFSYVQLFIITFLSGTFFLPTQVLPAKLIGAWFDRSEMAAANGVYGSGAGLGITIAFAVGSLFPTTVSALAFCAGGYVLMALLWVVVVKMPVREADAVGDGASAARVGSSEASVPTVSFKAVLKSRNMWFVMICGGLAAGAPLLLNSYMINAFMANGFPQAYTSVLGVIFNIALVLGAIIPGIIVAKLGRYNIPYFVFCLGGGILIFLTYVLPAGVLTFILLPLGGFLSASSLSMNFARIPLLPLTGDFGAENIGIAGGMNNTAMGVCMFVLPTIAAAVFGTNYLAVFLTLLGFFVVMAVVGGVLIPELGEKGELACRAREK